MLREWSIFLSIKEVLTFVSKWRVYWSGTSTNISAIEERNLPKVGRLLVSEVCFQIDDHQGREKENMDTLFQAMHMYAMTLSTASGRKASSGLTTKTLSTCRCRGDGIISMRFMHQTARGTNPSHHSYDVRHTCSPESIMLQRNFRVTADSRESRSS